MGFSCAAYCAFPQRWLSPQRGTVRTNSVALDASLQRFTTVFCSTPLHPRGSHLELHENTETFYYSSHLCEVRAKNVIYAHWNNTSCHCLRNTPVVEEALKHFSYQHFTTFQKFQKKSFVIQKPQQQNERCAFSLETREIVFQRRRRLNWVSALTPTHSAGRLFITFLSII